MTDSEIERLRRKGRDMDLSRVFDLVFDVIPLTGGDRSAIRRMSRARTC